MRSGTGAETETRAAAEMGTGTRMGRGTGTRIGLGRVEREGKKPRKVHKSCRRHVGNGETWVGNKKP